MSAVRCRLFAFCALAVLHATAAADDRAPMTLVEVKAAIDAGTLPGVHGVIVRRRGETLAEWYFSGRDQNIVQDLGHVDFGPETLHDVRSVTKSVVSLLFGIALNDGLIGGIDGAVVDRFPEYTDLPAATTADVKLRHVLSMTSGWKWDEFTYPYTDPRNSEIAMERSDDPLRYVLTQARVSAPGERFTYSGGDVALIGAVIARATGMPLDRYADEKLFAPLGIERSEWSKRRDVPRAASGLRLTPRAMAAIGELVLARGRWHGRQIVPAAWIDAATREQIAIPRGRAPGTGYGYFWWLGEMASERWISASGNGGQRIWIMPSRELVVVTTMGLYDSPEQGRVPIAIIEAALAATRT